jgi:hypothetical protein
MPDVPNPQRSGPERRRSKRIPVVPGIQLDVMKIGMTVRIPATAVQPNPNIALALLDLSSGGMRILSWADLNIKERVIVKFSIPQIISKKFNCRGMVKWKKPVQVQEKPCFELGIEYIDMPAEDKIRLRELER